MIRGLFLHNAPNTPVVELAVSWEEAVARHYFVLDTGFTGDLKVTPDTAQKLGLIPFAIEEVAVADGQRIDAGIAMVIAHLENAAGPIIALIAPGAQLAGIGLFTKFGYKAVVDCKYRTVELHKAA